MKQNVSKHSIKRGDIIELDIIDHGMNGEGIGKKDNLTVFVPYAISGEKLKCSVTFIKKNFATAKVIKVLNKSPNRAVPQCPVYYKCGGCDLMHIDSCIHKNIKQEQFLNNMRKIAKVSVTVDKFVNSSLQFGYRNKVQLPFGMDNGKVVVGYYINNSHDIVPYSKCMLVGSWAHDLTNIIVTYANTHQIPVYNESTKEGLLRHLVLRKVGETVSIVLVINGDSLPNANMLIAMLENHKVKYNLHININKEDTNVIVGDRYSKLKGNDTISCNILNTQVEVAPQSFMQVNDDVRDKIYAEVASLLGKSDILIDLYSGVGITSNILAPAVKHVYSIEIVKEAVRSATRMAELNGNKDKITCICGDVIVELPKLIESIRNNQAEAGSKIAVLLDPPRKGCEATVMATIAQLAPAQILYISCNHATLARDLTALKLTQAISSTDDGAAIGSAEQSSQAEDALIGAPQAEDALIGAPQAEYDITNVILHDMFPQTHHIETLVCLTRKS